MTLILMAGLTIAPGIADADANGRRAKVDFIGVFHPVFTGGRLDRERCPDRSHPILFTFQGEAFTTLGHATFEQSHCEAPDHSSFRRGEQTITFDSGDVLYGAYQGDLLATPTTAMDGRLIIDGTYRNMGGTGTLSNAHGGGISAGFVDTTNGSAEVTVSGSL
jgi:hypothetical protein